MKIKRLEIYGYGKWVNQSFDIDAQLQIFYGPNETGKSTIQSFIKSILFGFPDKRRRKFQQNRYEPRHGESYGGRILLSETPYGEIWVERTAKFLTIQTKEGQVLEDSVLKEILGGLDENVFDYFYAFNLNNLQELANIGSEDLNDFFLSIGTLGSDKFLAVAKQFEKDTDELYKRQGTNPKLNQLLTEFEVLQRQVQQIKQKHQRYSYLLSQQQAENSAINQLNESIKDIEHKVRNLDQLINRYEIHLKDLVVQRKLDQLIYTEIPEEAPTEVDAALRDNRESEKKLAEYRERIRNIDEELTQLTRYTWAKNRQQDRKEWQSATEEIKQVQTQIEQLQRQIHEAEEMLDHLAKQGQFYPEKIVQGEEYDRAIDRGLTIQGNKDQIQEENESIRSERKFLLEQRKAYQNNAAIARQQVAQLENQRVNDEEQLIQQTQLSHYLPGFIILLAGVSYVFYQFIQGQSLSSLFVIVAVLLAMVGLGQMIYIYLKHRNLVQSFQNNPIHQKIIDLHEQELQFVEQGKAFGLEINDREMKMEQLQEDLAKLMKEQQSWLSSMGFYPTADPEIVLKANPVKHYLETKVRYEKLLTEEAEQQARISAWVELIKPLLTRFPFEQTERIRPLIRHVEEVEASLIQTMQRANALEDRRKLTTHSVESEEEAIKQRSQLIQNYLDQASAKDVIDFKQKINTNKEIEDLQAKHQLFAEQTQDYAQELAKIQNRQELSEQLEQQQQMLQRAKENLTPHMHQLANVMVEINRLQEDGSYEELSQQIENKKAKIRDVIIEWGQKHIATALIYDTLRYGMENPLPEMNEKVNELFYKLSGGRYTQVKINKNSIKVKQFSDILFEPHELSQGTLEQLYVALRLAFVESAKQMVSMPIIIDDAFVNFDEQRRQSMYQVLKEMSERHQILFFTFDQLAIDIFEPDHEIDLEELDQA
ncbi:AAA family ATPase [Ignavigranum ruoffiae]